MVGQRVFRLWAWAREEYCNVSILFSLVLCHMVQEAGNGREVTGQQVQARARQEHQRLRGTDGQFQASPGWLERFRRRYNLRSSRQRRGRRRGRQPSRQQDSPPPSFKCEVWHSRSYVPLPAAGYFRFNREDIKYGRSS